MNRLTFRLGSLILVLAGALGAIKSSPRSIWFFREAITAPVLLLVIGLIFFTYSLLQRDSFSVRISLPSRGAFPSLPRAIIPAIIISTMIVTLLTFFRYRLFLPPPVGLGDSMLLLEHMPVYSRLFGYLDSFDELISLFFNSKLYLLLHHCCSYNADFSYAVMSFLSGFIYFIIMILFLSGRPIRDFILGFLIIISSPIIQLFAGYVENYPLPAMFLFAITTYGARLLERDRNISSRHILFLGFLSALGVLHHLILGSILLALIYLIYVLSEKNIQKFIRLGFYGTIPALILLAVVWSYFLFFIDYPVGIGESFALHPPVYPFKRLISTTHFADMINLVFLGSPLIPFYLILRYSDKNALERATEKENHAETFVFIAAITFLVVIFFLDPMLGYPADWDLHTMFAHPMSLFLFYRFRRLLRNEQHFHHLLFLFMAFFFSAYVTLSFLMRNHAGPPEAVKHLENSRKNVNRVLSLADSDPLMTPEVPGEIKKTYIKALMFQLRSHEALSILGTPESISIGQRLDHSMEKLRKVLHAQRNLKKEGKADHSIEMMENQKAFQEVWTELTILNTEIHQELEKNGISGP